MKFVKMMMRVDIEVAMQVPDKTPLGIMPDADNARTEIADELREKYSSDGARVVEIAVISGPEVVEL